MGELVAFPVHRARDLPEPYVTKRDLAEHLKVTPRWIELRQKKDGLPHHKDKHSRLIRYRLSEVLAWLEARQAS